MESIQRTGFVIHFCGIAAPVKQAAMQDDFRLTLAWYYVCEDYKLIQIAKVNTPGVNLELGTLFDTLTCDFSHIMYSVKRRNYRIVTDSSIVEQPSHNR